MPLKRIMKSRTLPFLTAVLCVGCADARDQYVVGNAEFSTPRGSKAQNLYATADGRVVLTWHEPLADGGSALKLAVRETSGTWSEPRTVMQGDSFFVNWADFPSLIELPNGQWLAHWLQKTAPTSYAYHVKLAITGDQGATWGKPFSPHRDVSATEHGFVSMVPWQDGAALVWLDGRGMKGDGSGGHGTPGGAMTIRFTTLAADGHLGADMLIDDRTCECCQTALARTANGLVAAYRDRSETELRNIAISRFTGGSWTAPRPVHDDGWHYPGCPVNGPSLAAMGDTVAIAWFTAPNEKRRVSVAFSTDGGATFGPPIRVDGGRPVGRVDVELLFGGALLVLWLEATREGAEVRARRVERSGRMGKPWVVTRTREERSSGFPRMVRVGKELVFAWTEPADGGVRVAVAKPSS